MKKGFGFVEMEREDNYGFAFEGAINFEKGNKRTKLPKEDRDDMLRGRKVNKRRKKAFN